MDGGDQIYGIKLERTQHGHGHFEYEGDNRYSIPIKINAITFLKSALLIA